MCNNYGFDDIHSTRARQLERSARGGTLESVPRPSRDVARLAGDVERALVGVAYMFKLHRR